MSDEAPKPGRYDLRDKYPAVVERDDEHTVRTRGALASLTPQDRDYILARLSEAKKGGSTPPPKKEHTAWQVLVPILVAIVLTVAGAGLVVWRDDALAQQTQLVTDHRVDGLAGELHEHAASGSHPATIAGLARIGAQLDSITVRLDRIERQLDQRTTRPR